MNDVPTAECGSEYNPNNSAKVVLAPATKLAHHDLFMAMGEQNAAALLLSNFARACRRIDGGNYLFNFRP